MHGHGAHPGRCAADGGALPVRDRRRRFVVDPDVPAGLPFRPTPFTASFLLNVAGVDVTTTVPVQFRSEGNIFSGEKRSRAARRAEVSRSTVSPEIVVVPLRRTPATARGTRTRRSRDGDQSRPGAAKATVQLELPQGWKSRRRLRPSAFTREDEAMTVRFRLLVPPGPMLKPGDSRDQSARHRRRDAVRSEAIRWSSIRTRRVVTCCARRRSWSRRST